MEEKSPPPKQKKTVTDINEAIETISKTASYRRLAAVAATFWGVGAVFYHIVEKLNWVDAFYFTTITLATVGYGDIVPKTNAGKIFTMFYVFFGITIFVVLARIVISEFAVRRSTRRNKD